MPIVYRLALTLDSPPSNLAEIFPDDRRTGFSRSIRVRQHGRAFANSASAHRRRRATNLNIPLWQLVRGSTAAPTYFPPEVVKVGEQEFIFVDGGMTMYNNPAFQFFLIATVEAYNLAWPTGEKEMLLVSIGTGTDPKANANLAPGQMNLIYNASSIPSALMFAASNEQDFLCRERRNPLRTADTREDRVPADHEVALKFRE
jgi:patatin-like phospholipase/acyl hydrolase